MPNAAIPQQQPRVTDNGYGRFTKDEMDLIKRTFGNNEPLLKLLRKVFLPALDLNAPLGQMIDLWMTVDMRNLSEIDKQIRLESRNALIVHLEQMLIQLNSLAGIKEETAEERSARLKKDSNK